VRGLVGLKTLAFTPRVDSLDYSPLLSLQHAELVRVHAVRGMSPSALELEWSVPGMTESAARDYAASQQGWKRVQRKPEPQPTIAEKREALAAVDEVWASLLDGRRTRLEAIVWARNTRSSRLDLVLDGLHELEQLTGYPWAHPPDSIHLKLFGWLEEWRAAVRQFANDPDGEPRREALRRISRLAAGRSPFVRTVFDEFVEKGLLGPDDESALGVPPAH
jgi:hypothetical protein